MAGVTLDRRGGRQAVVIVHGMGEQRPLDALTGFIEAGLPQDASGKFYSHPDIVTNSYESRRFLVPESPTASRSQTEFFEYHWAHLMQGNRLGYLWPTFRRLLLKRYRLVPTGLRGLWFTFWMLIAISAGTVTFGISAGLLPEQWSDPEKALTTLLATVVGTGAIGSLLTYLLTRVAKFVPGILRDSFVDVVRYLDTSPRSYAVRRDIRKGFVELLGNLHTSTYKGDLRYQRIVIVAHSLGAYIAYDGICHLWGNDGADTMPLEHRTGCRISKRRRTIFPLLTQGTVRPKTKSMLSKKRSTSCGMGCVPTATHG